MDLFQLTEMLALPSRYNIAPTQPVAAVRAEPGGGRVLSMFRWGLIPNWSKDDAIGNRLINARAETVADKPAFRHAFRKRRCLIPADGFYEWRKAGSKSKEPFHFSLRNGQPFAFAGLWEQWQGRDKTVESCTLLTTAANDLVRPIHERMPLILPPADYQLWLDAAVQEPERLLPLLKPYPAEAMTAHPVGTLVNNARNEDPRCVVPLEQWVRQDPGPGRAAESGTAVEPSSN